MNPPRVPTPRDAMNQRRPAHEALRDEKAKARALQRWENEGGKVSRALKSAEDARKKQPR